MLETKNKLLKIPIIGSLILLLTKIKLPGLEGLSIYDLLELYVIGIVKGTLTTRASAVAFSFFMAIFPFLLFILVIIPYIPIDDFQTDFLAFLESFLPPQTSDFFYDNIFSNIKSRGLISSVFLVSLFLMANGVNAVFSGFENSYYTQLKRNMFRQYLYALMVALILSFLLLITVAGITTFEIYILYNSADALENIGFKREDSVSFLADASKYLFFVLMIYLATATLYYFGTPERSATKFRSIGALFTTLLIMLNSYLFGIYINNFSQYNELYGSIGALLILLVYLWLNSNIILLGYELNSALRKLRHNNNQNTEV